MFLISFIDGQRGDDDLTINGLIVQGAAFRCSRHRRKLRSVRHRGSTRRVSEQWPRQKSRHPPTRVRQDAVEPGRGRATLETRRPVSCSRHLSDPKGSSAPTWW